MSDIIVKAASYLGPEGYGNSRTGLKPWPDALAQAVARGEVPDTSWATLFSSSCPRFGRMDALSRLGLMAVELLGVDFSALPERDRDELGVCLETRFGCLAADLNFLETLSPSVFTYTLPSTAIGEICIRHRLRGPVLCLIPANDNEQQALEQARARLRDGGAARCLCIGCDALAEPAVRRLGQRAGTQAGALYLGPDEHPSPSLACDGPLLELCRRLCVRAEIQYKSG
jgi:3-oxoacyl-(acyl-carrier-protein) synthase